MDDFNASLVRERMTFVNDAFDAAGNVDTGKTSVRSNRIVLTLDAKGVTERVVIRAQTMHITLALAAKCMFSYYRNGLFSTRSEAYDWEGQWDSVLSSYEKTYNPDIWAAIYVNGNPVFKTTKSQYVDIIEKCALMSGDNYEASIGFAEDALKQVGKPTRISQSSTVAAVFNDREDRMRCGIIKRNKERPMTIKFTAIGGTADHRVMQSLATAGAFLEALNLRYVADTMQDKIRTGAIKQSSPEAGQLRSAVTRLVFLNKIIETFESGYDVSYLPKKPDLFHNAY